MSVEFCCKGFLSVYLGALTEFRKETINFFKSVRPSAWNISAPTGQLFIKFYTWLYFENLQRKLRYC
jgi:hypothetical protein